VLEEDGRAVCLLLHRLGARLVKEYLVTRAYYFCSYGEWGRVYPL
jgi:hypothetical protein